MKEINTKKYLALIFIHVLLGIMIFAVPSISKIYNILIFIVGLGVIIKSQNKNQEVIMVAAYVVSAEVIMRMTEGIIFNELVKYEVVFFMIIGMIYSGFSRNAIPIWIYLLLLVPGIILSTVTLDITTDIRKAITFNIVGPICLAISGIYCYQRKLTQSQIDSILLTMCFPIITTVTYMYLYTPNVKDVVTGTSSNFATSGGFGPNQVATILGFGIFLFFIRTLFYSRNKIVLLINIFLLLLVTFRGIVTFSRGGVITGGVMILLLILKVFTVTNAKGRSKLLAFAGIAFFALIAVWTYSSYQTGGMIEKRYANQDPAGREKESQLSGRETLIETELQMFLDHPILGIGVGKNKEYREELTGVASASHNEISRMLAEHGTLGIFAFLILLFTPAFLSLENKQHLYLFSFVIFWLLTINHAAMRLAAPAFIYALSLLKIDSFEKPALHRE